MGELSVVVDKTNSVVDKTKVESNNISTNVVEESSANFFDAPSQIRQPIAPEEMSMNVVQFHDAVSSKNFKKPNTYSTMDLASQRLETLKKLQLDITKLQVHALENKKYAAAIGPSNTVEQGIKAKLYDIGHLRVEGRLPKSRITNKRSQHENLLAVQGKSFLLCLFFMWKTVFVFYGRFNFINWEFSYFTAVHEV